MGQLGDGTLTNRWVPVSSGVSDILSIHAGGVSSSALAIQSENAKVAGWGNNGSWQLNREAPPNFFNIPIDITLDHARDVGTGAGHGLLVRDDGTVLSWGFNFGGYVLGRSTLDDNDLAGAVKVGPNQSTSLGNIVKVSAGTFHSLALAIDGSVWAWGDNFYGQTGFPTSRVAVDAAEQVPNSVRCNAIAAGGEFSLCLTPTGTVRAWGLNDRGQRGQTEPPATSGSAPNVVVIADGADQTELDQVIAIAAGTRHALALRADGTVWAWGENNRGQLGQTPSPSQFSAKQVPGLAGAIAIAAGDAHSLALLSNGRVVAWGRNDEGQLGDGTTSERSTPGLVSNLFGVRQIAAGFRSSYAVTGVIITDLRLSVATTVTTTSGRRGTTGTTISYALTVTNDGSRAVPSFELHDQLPTNTSFVSASVGCSGVAVGAHGMEICTGGPLGPGQSQTLTINVQTTSTSVTNSPFILPGSGLDDTNDGNNAVTVETTIGKKKK